MSINVMNELRMVVSLVVLGAVAAPFQHAAADGNANYEVSGPYRDDGGGFSVYVLNDQGDGIKINRDSKKEAREDGQQAADHFNIGGDQAVADWCEDHPDDCDGD